MQDLISIIVPIYNAENYIEDCIHSIINQSYGNLEIFLIDDGSTDNSARICDSFLKKDIRIKVVHNTFSEGLAAMKNLALAQVKGEFVAFVQATDYINPEFITDLYQACIRSNGDIAQCKYISVSEDISFSRFSDEYKQKLYEEDLVDMDSNEIQLYYEDTDNGENVFNSMYVFEGRDMIKNLYNERASQTEFLWNKLYRRCLFENNDSNVINSGYKNSTNIIFPENRKYEEEAVIYRIFYEASLIVCLDKPLYYYREIDKEKYSVKDFDKIISIEERIDYFLYNRDKELYALTLRKLFEELIDARDNTRRYIDNSKKTQSVLHKKARKKLWKILSTPEFCDFSIEENIEYKFQCIKKMWFYTVDDIKHREKDKDIL